MKYQFDEKLKIALEVSGWHPIRKVAIDKYSSEWKIGGYRVFARALEFAESFGGLKIKHLAYAGQATDESEFDPVVAARRLDRAWVVEDYEKLAGESLIPVGMGYSGHLTFLMGEGGGMYGGFDDYFSRIGRSVEEAMANILFARAFETLSE